MLRQLDIHNIALIDHVSLAMENGLHIMTGETGAGKSIIIDAIHAILGGRVSKELIRTGKEKALVEAVFEVDRHQFGAMFESLGLEPEEDGTLIISREFTTAGKNTCRINGKMATLSMLKEVGEQLIDIHGQHENQSLLRTESHIQLLDSFGGAKILALKQEYAKTLAEYKQVRNKLKELSGSGSERERKIDLLKYQIEEIRKAKLKPREEEELNQQKIVLANAEKIMAALSSIYELLVSGNNRKNSASDSISDALGEFNGIARLGESYSELCKRLEDLSFQLEDITEEIRKERDQVENNPQLLEELEERLDLIYKLKKKYGGSYEEILQYCANIQQELEELTQSETRVRELAGEQARLEALLEKQGMEIHTERVVAAQILESRIGSELHDLEMKNAQFKVNLELEEPEEQNGGRRYLHNGLDRVEFLISPNLGEPLKPLSKIASGGEMSRIMLAIKTILANVDAMPTLIFDEIDIGVSGKAAQKVGEKLSYLSRNHQVLCVTHLAQIAAMADAHYLIEKTSDGGHTSTKVDLLSSQGKQKELARILGGAHISDITLKHAEEMLENAKKIK